MPLQNRVTPAGDIIATPARGTFMGNRGILHDETRTLVRTTRNAMWLICRLRFKDRRRVPMSPGTYTELFFLDEAVALAAGHRPCGECRREHHRAFIDAVNADGGEAIRDTRELDRRLKRSRAAPDVTTAVATLPDGVFIRLGDNDFRLLWDGALHRWSPHGYDDPMAVSEVGEAPVMTPSVSVAALRHGYPVTVHPTLR